MQEWLFVGGGGTNGRHVVSVGERGRSAPGGRREKVIGGGGGGVGCGGGCGVGCGVGCG